MENLGLGRVTGAASSLVLTSQPLAGTQPQGLAESCLPHKSALDVGEILDIAQALPIGTWEVQGSWYAPHCLQIDALAPFILGEV